MSNDFFKINIFFTSSFKINLNEKYKVNEDYLTIIQKKNKRVLCKNFVMFLFILKKSKIFEDLVYFVFPKRGMSGHNSILRPPYKNKKSRHPIGFEKWNFKLSFKLAKSEKINFIDLNSIFLFLKKIKKITSFFDSNIANQKKIVIKVPFNNSDNFILNNFK